MNLKEEWWLCESRRPPCLKCETCQRIMKDRDGKVDQPSDVAQEIAKAFRSGPLEHRDLNGHGISEMSVVVCGVLVSLSWYALGPTPRRITIDGKSSMPDGSDSRHIFEAAWFRARQLTDEDMAAVSAKINAHNEKQSQ